MLTLLNPFRTQEMTFDVLKLHAVVITLIHNTLDQENPSCSFFGNLTGAAINNINMPN